MAIDEQSSLACGRPIDQVWEHIDEPPDEHEVTCPECQQARRSLARLDEATQRLRLDDEADPELVPPPGMKVSVMDLARAEVRRGARLPLRPPTRADLQAELTISEQSVAGVVRSAADALGGVHARRCKVRLDGNVPLVPVAQSGGEDGVDPVSQSVHVQIDVGVALSASRSILAATGELRSAVASSVHRATGMTASKINIVVEDLFDA